MSGTAALPERVVVIGAGTMGARIALSFAKAGSQVCATSRRESTLRAAEEVLLNELDSIRPKRRPRVLFEGTSRTNSQVTGRGSIDLRSSADEELGSADLVIETVRENLSDKLAVLGHVQRFCRPDAIVTTNTSSLNLFDLELAITPPGRFAGLHWFHPADLIQLVEVVPASSTEDATLETLGRWMSGIDKTPVILKEAVPGFIANRLQYALLREAYSLVIAGVCSFSDVDNAVTAGLGPRWAALGPFQCMDFAGLDVHLAVAKLLFADLACDRVAPKELEDLVDEGHLGVKSGFGLGGQYSPEQARGLANLRDEMLHRVADFRRSWEEGIGQSVEEGRE